MSFRPEYTAALRVLARAFEEVQQRGFQCPVLVGGAAVEFWTGGSVVSGDFDILTGADEYLLRALEADGFRRPTGPGVLTRGLVHDDLEIGIELVSGAYFGGNADRTRIVIVEVGGGKVAFPPVEDIIADRIGQYASSPRGVPEMRQQAVILYALADGVDEAYLSRRIQQETIDSLSLDDLKSWHEEYLARRPGHED
ncbi:MAG: hypothetical protein HQL40_07005 [Alphaproteobacteria bacterium]|nr:hypothetical protein [Alphaproteobacteria bacterium]